MLRQAALVLVALAGAARAEVRSFTETYEYGTEAEGRTTLEGWHRQGRATWDADTPELFEQQVEILYGLTEHWDLALFTAFAEATNRPFTLDATRIESRYRFADRAEWPVDTEVLLAVAKRFDRSVYDVEGRLVLARDFDRVTVAANAIGTAAFGNDVDDVADAAAVGWAGGAAYTVHPKLRLGAESWGFYRDHTVEAWAGPALGWSPSPKLWLAATAGFGITDDADAFAVSAIVGVEL